MRLRTPRGALAGRGRVVRAAGLVLAGALVASGCTSGAARPSSFMSVLLNTQAPVTAELGFTAVDVTPSDLGGLPRNRRALVWLGGYDKTRCTLITSDADLRQQFATYRLARDPRVIGYFLADEPDTDHNCPRSPAEVRARSALVRSLDPDGRRFTLVNVDDPNEFGAFDGTADVIATDAYPCQVAEPCDWGLIPNRIASLNQAGISRYAAMLQVFSGGDWRWPTADELQGILDQWRQSNWCGALFFSWEWQGGRLADHPELLAVLKQFNAHLPSATTPCG